MDICRADEERKKIKIDIFGIKEALSVMDDELAKVDRVDIKNY